MILCFGPLGDTIMHWWRLPHIIHLMSNNARPTTPVLLDTDIPPLRMLDIYFGGRLVFSRNSSVSSTSDSICVGNGGWVSLPRPSLHLVDWVAQDGRLFILELGVCSQGRHWLNLCALSPVFVILSFCNLCMVKFWPEVWPFLAIFEALVALFDGVVYGFQPSLRN